MFYWNGKEYREGDYLPLETIDDLVDQFNYIGFHDLCIYPPTSDMAQYGLKYKKITEKNITVVNYDLKGINAVYYGHTTHNQTGK